MWIATTAVALTTEAIDVAFIAYDISQNGVQGYHAAAFLPGISVKAVKQALPVPQVRGNPNTATSYEKIIVDINGNAIPLRQGEIVTGSPDGRFIQVRDASGNPTGLRIDGPHNLPLIQIHVHRRHMPMFLA